MTSPARDTEWTRFRDDDDPMIAYVDWPLGCSDIRDLLVWNSCDGYHIWSRYFGDCPPGTHYARLLAAPDATSAAEQPGTEPQSGVVNPPSQVES